MGGTVDNILGGWHRPRLAARMLEDSSALAAPRSPALLLAPLRCWLNPAKILDLEDLAAGRPGT
ncbi:MAG: hypothetical protein ACPIOQ_74525, partial [Promethearchaeia archaeon]